MRFYLCHEVALRCLVRVYASYAKSLFLISYYHRSRSLAYDNIDVVDEFRKWLELARLSTNVSIEVIFFKSNDASRKYVFLQRGQEVTIRVWLNDRIGDTRRLASSTLVKTLSGKTAVSRTMAVSVSKLRGGDAGSPREDDEKFGRRAGAH